MGDYTLSIVRVGHDAVVVMGHKTERAAQRAVDGMIALIRKNGELTIKLKLEVDVEVIDG